MTPRFLAPAASLGLALMPLSAAAQAQGADDWKFQGSLYLYFPSVGGSSTFPPGNGGSSATVDASKILDNLKAAFMGSLEATRGPYGVYTDVIYIDLGNTKSQSRAIGIGGVLPVGAEATIDYSLSGWLFTLAGTWRAVATPTYKMEWLAGTRMLDMKQTLDWQLGGNIGSIALADRTGHRTDSLQNWDAIFGVKGRAAFGDGARWFAPYYLDVGAGESKFTWQATVGLGYSFGWGDVVGAWRYVGYDMKSGKTMESVNFNGPAVAAVFRW